MQAPLDRRGFVVGTGATFAAAGLARQDGGPRLTHGPFRCDATHSELGLWARASMPGEYVLRVVDPQADRPEALAVPALATAENDLTLRWTSAVLGGERLACAVAIEHAGRELWRGECVPLAAPRRLHEPTIALGSCADDRRFPDQPVWDRMRERRPDLIVMLGDTPYIDSTDLAVQRERYTKFYEQPQLARLLRQVPFAGTWDDHDYASNDRFGAVEGRENSRRAFLENHGGGEWGSAGRGIFTKRRVGDIEIYLLDTRWFADTEPSPFDAAQRTLLGAAQWSWLQQNLLHSDASFKVLCSGMIWNDATRPAKVDFWGHWAHERDALFAWIGRKRISGVVLVGGDIHRTRIVEHQTKVAAGYDVVELITSPIANTVIETANAPHPGLRFDAGVEQTFLLLRSMPAAEPRLVAEMVDGSGKSLHTLERSLRQLTRA